MAKQYIVTLSDAEDKALHHVAMSAQEWIDNVVHQRCRIAMEEIIKTEVDRKLAAGQPITGNRDDIVLSAPIKSAKEMEDEINSAKVSNQ
jgi:hypothetical protein